MTLTPEKREQGAFADLFDQFEAGFPLFRSFAGAHMMRVEENLQVGEYVLRAELPGIDPDKDVEISIANGVLTVTAERREEHKEQQRSEFRYGKVQPQRHAAGRCGRGRRGHVPGRDPRGSRWDQGRTDGPNEADSDFQELTGIAVSPLGTFGTARDKPAGVRWGAARASPPSRSVLEVRHESVGRRSDPVATNRLDERPRDGRIVGLHHPDGTPPYDVEWSDTGRVALVFPGPDARVEHLGGEHAASSAALTSHVIRRPGGSRSICSTWVTRSRRTRSC